MLRIIGKATLPCFISVYDLSLFDESGCCRKESTYESLGRYVYNFTERRRRHGDVITMSPWNSERT